MQFLVEMRLVDEVRNEAIRDGKSFVERVIVPTLERVEELGTQDVVVGGGVITGTIGLMLLVEVETARELDEALVSLPLWPMARTSITPLSSFADRAKIVTARFAKPQAQ